MNGSHLLRYLAWLGALLTLVAVVFAYEVTFRSLHVRPATSTDVESAPLLPTTFPTNIPAPAPTDYTDAQKGFQYLVSYTMAGFSPPSLSVNKGETVRFTNNAPTAVRIVAESGSSYPGSSDCGTSALDSCKEIAHGEYWEFTFNDTGTWTYVNPLDTSKRGTITVK